MSRRGKSELKTKSRLEFPRLLVKRVMTISGTRDHFMMIKMFPKLDCNDGCSTLNLPSKIIVHLNCTNFMIYTLCSPKAVEKP